MRTPTQAFQIVPSLLILLVSIAGLLTTGCVAKHFTIDKPQSSEKHMSAGRQTQSSPQSVPLFVHLLTPRYYTDPPIPPKRIVMTRISLGEEFAVSVGDSDPVLTGRVKRRGAKFFAQLRGRSHTTVNRFDGEIELEKPVESQGGGFSGGIWTVRFVLSTNSDCSLFLKE